MGLFGSFAKIFYLAKILIKNRWSEADEILKFLVSSKKNPLYEVKV